MIKKSELDVKVSETILVFGELTKEELGEKSLHEKMALFVSVFYSKFCEEFFTKINMPDTMNFQSFMRLSDEELALFDKYLALAVAAEEEKFLVVQ